MHFFTFLHILECILPFLFKKKHYYFEGRLEVKERKLLNQLSHLPTGYCDTSREDFTKPGRPTPFP